MDPLSILSQLAESGANPALRNIVKALSGTVGAGSNLGALTGAGALRAENLDPVLAAAVVENKHFKLFNKLFPGRRDSFSILDQSVRKNSIGGFQGSALSNETGSNQVERVGDYQRLVMELGVFTTKRSVSLVTAFQGALQAQAGVVDFSAAEEEDVNAALEIMTTVEDALFYGNKTITTDGIDGLFTQIPAGASANVIDLAGAALTSQTQITPLLGKLTSLGNWGSPDLAYMSAMVKADLDNGLSTGYRVNLDKEVPSTITGVPVRAMRYSSVGAADGLLELDPSAFITEDKMPIVANGASLATLTIPASFSAPAPAGTGSKFLAGHAGTYYYAVEAWVPGQVSDIRIAGGYAVAAGQSVTLTIGAGGSETYYKVYRSKRNGAGAVASDFRYIGMVKRTASSTVFVDDNSAIPGTSEMVILTSDPRANALRWIQMLPLTKIPFAMTTFSYPWGAILIGALRTQLPKRHAVIKNILPSNNTWNPF